MRPTIDELVRHAERFGPELVLETAREMLAAEFHGWHTRTKHELPRPVELTWMPYSEQERVLDERERQFAEYHAAYIAKARELKADLQRLELELAVIGATEKRPAKTSSRRTRAETIALVRRLRADGYTAGRIAETIPGVSEKTVRRYMGDRGNRPQKRLSQAAKTAPKQEPKVITRPPVRLAQPSHSARIAVTA